MELEDELLTSPKEFPRPLIRAVLVSLTKNMEFSREAEWRSRAHDFAHAADALGRYLRGASVVDPGLWWEYADWFHGFDRSLYGALDWVSSQYALMFPSFHVQGQVVEILRRWLTDSSDLQQVAVATQRLAATDPALARAVIRRRIDEAADPLIVRTFALGLLMTGEIDLARGALRRDPRNRLLIRMLDRTDWTTPPASEDFDPPDPPKTPFPL